MILVEFIIKKYLFTDNTNFPKIQHNFSYTEKHNLHNTDYQIIKCLHHFFLRIFIKKYNYELFKKKI